MTVFEYLAHRQPAVLLVLEASGLLSIRDHAQDTVGRMLIVSRGWGELHARWVRRAMGHAAWRRVRRRIRQVRAA